MRALLVVLLLILPRPAHALAMQISNISDFNLPTWSLGYPAVSANMDICIYGIDLFGLTNYAITVSSNPSGYRLTNGAQTIAYTLHWEDSGVGNLGSSPGTQLTDGVKLSNRHNHNILLPDCIGTGPNARLKLAITQAAMTAAPSGTYNGTITLLLSPN